MANDNGLNYEASMMPAPFGIFTNVPEGKLVIYEGRFTHQIKQKGVGFHLSLPWTYKTVIITVDRSKDYAPESYRCKDGNMITIDISINYKVVDPVTFYKQKEAGKILKDNIRAWVNASVNSHTLKQIQQNKIDIYADASAEIQKFEQEYGIRISSIALQRLTYSNEMQKTMEQKAAFDTQIEKGKVRNEILKNKLEMLFTLVPDLTTEDKKHIIQDALKLENDNDFSKLFSMAYAMSSANQAAMQNAQSQNGKSK